ncbi:alpha/beta hydrolase [Wukongibacter sp. M2B1]|uniref:alpha/beta hydrolase n=1 Tax=Wukongibacter sp. M2B1 TaxID=3088895 RepID=UPI003D7BC8F6
MKKNNLRKRKINWIKIASSIIIIISIGSIYQRIMMNKETQGFIPKGELYNINSHDMHLYSTGKGDTTVVFISGSGTPCAFTDFYYLQRNLQQYAKTISFDHAGYGWSERTNIPRTVDTLANELHELLEKSNQSSPYILVGHSLASLEVIRFAQQYPNEVKGIVLLDGGSPEFYAMESEFKIFLINRITAGLRASGAIRCLGNLRIILHFTAEELRYSMLPSHLKDIDISMYYNKIGDKSNISVIRNLNENAQTVIDNGSLKDIPLYILSSDSGEEWEEVQQQMLSWSNISNQKTIKNAQHYIHWSNREIVVSKILEMLNIK